MEEAADLQTMQEILTKGLIIPNGIQSFWHIQINKFRTLLSNIISAIIPSNGINHI